MLKFNLNEDEDLCDAVNVFVSGLLPHEKYDSTCFSNILSVLFKYVKLEEFQLEYRLILESLCELRKLKITFPEYVPKLERKTFERILETSVMDIVIRPELGVCEWLDYMGLPNDLNNQIVREDACQKLCRKALELYDTCYSLAIDSNDVLNHKQELESAMLTHASVQSINLQAEIIRHNARIGRKVYQGSLDWLEYSMKSLMEIQDRLKDVEEDNVVTLDSVETSFALLEELQEALVPIASYGIPEIDAYTPILRHRFVVIVGQENIGKTKFVVDQAVNVLLAGRKVVYMCGESAKSRVFADIMINYVYKKFGIIIRDEHLAVPDMCPPDVRKIIGMSINEIINDGNITFCDAFSYDTYYQELVDLYEKLNFDVVIVDHSCALEGSTGDGSLKAKIDSLAEDSRKFKKNFPVCVMVTSHPSTLAKASARAGKATEDSSTKGSQNLSTEADEVFVLKDNETLRKQDLVFLENVKRRNARRVSDLIVLKKKFEVSSFIYDPSLQEGESRITLEREAALNLIEEQCKSDDDVYNLGGE